MNLYKHTLIALVATSGFFMSCDRHLVVPAPLPPVTTVDVDCQFSGLVSSLIDTISYTIQGGSNSYACNLLVTKQIQTSPSPSNAVYSDSLGSTSTAFKAGIKLDMGQFVWTDNGTSNPTISEFQNFFSGPNLELQFGDSTDIPYDNNAVNGVQITWYNENGIPYYSRDTSTYPGTFYNFMNVVYEADNNNEYVKWSSLFTCRLWNATGTDSLIIQNGNFQGAFKRRTQ